MITIAVGMSMKKRKSQTNVQRISLPMKEVCGKGYGVDCLRLDLLSIAGRLDRSFRLGPGFYLSHDPTVIASFDSIDNVTPNITETRLNSSIVGQMLRKNIRKYLHSLVLTVRLVDPVTVDMASTLSSRIVNFASPTNSTLSRGHHRKKGHHQTLIACVGMIAAIGLATLAALSGKALMTSLLALLLAGASALKQSHDASSIPCTAKTVGLIDAHSRYGTAVDRNEPNVPFYPLHVNPFEAANFYNNRPHNNTYK